MCPILFSLILRTDRSSDVSTNEQKKESFLRLNLDGRLFLIYASIKHMQAHPIYKMLLQCGATSTCIVLAILPASLSTLLSARHICHPLADGSFRSITSPASPRFLRRITRSRWIMAAMNIVVVEKKMNSQAAGWEIWVAKSVEVESASKL